MELKRAAAPNGRQPAWSRRHRMTAKPVQRQRCTPPAASRRGPGAPAFWAVIAGQVRPKVGARHRGPFLQAVHSNARALHPRARSVRGRARVVHRRARSGHRGAQLVLEWMWSSLASLFSVQCHPMVTVDYPSDRPAASAPFSLVQRMAVSWREWPYDARIRDRMAIASWNPAGHRGAAERRGGPRSQSGPRKFQKMGGGSPLTSESSRTSRPPEQMDRAVNALLALAFDFAVAHQAVEPRAGFAVIGSADQPRDRGAG
jgi:hypothetical protein